MNQDDLMPLFEQRDAVIANSQEFAEIDLGLIENEQIRELGRIVLETTWEDCPVFSCT